MLAAWQRDYGEVRPHSALYGRPPGLEHAAVVPGCAPELNPDELALNYVKRTGAPKSPLAFGESLQGRIEADLQAVQDDPAPVRSFSKTPTVAYIVA